MFASTLKIINSARAIFTFFLVIIAGLTVLLALPLAGKNKVLVVQSGSMNPAIPTGSIVIVVPSLSTSSLISPKEGLIKTPRYFQDDIVSYKQTKNFVTHRVIDIEKQEKGFSYLTKGDANKGADLTKVSENQISGKVILTIPALGYLIGLVKSKYGIIALIFLPAVFVIVAEIINIVKELKKKSLGNLPKGAIYIIPFFLCLIFLASTKGLAYFNDEEASLGNKFQAAAPSLSPTTSPLPSSSPFPSLSPSPSQSPAPTPLPIANHLVINEVMFDPPNTNACGSENDAEWVEIYNPTGGSVNLDTWSVGDSNFTDDLPNVALPAGSFVIVSDCAQSSITTIWPLPGGIIYIDLPGPIGNGLNNGGEYMRLLNGAALIDDMSYGSNTTAFSPSAPAPAANHSLERVPDGIDTNTALDFVDLTAPTPGN